MSGALSRCNHYIAYVLCDYCTIHVHVICAPISHCFSLYVFCSAFECFQSIYKLHQPDGTALLGPGGFIDPEVSVPVEYVCSNLPELKVMFCSSVKSRHSGPHHVELYFLLGKSL